MVINTETNSNNKLRNLMACQNELNSFAQESTVNNFDSGEVLPGNQGNNFSPKRSRREIGINIIAMMHADIEIAVTDNPN